MTAFRAVGRFLYAGNCNNNRSVVKIPFFLFADGFYCCLGRKFLNFIITKTRKKKEIVFDNDDRLGVLISRRRRACGENVV